VAPTGDLACYLSFPLGTLGHPADHQVELTVVRADDWGRVEQHLDLFGGQGTINVNSWAPTGDRLAFVAYPLDDDTRTHGVTDRLRR
jgi:hypothetical protein